MQEKTEFAENIATRIRAAERDLDAAIASFSVLQHDLTRYRAEAGFAAEMGHDGFLQVHQALGGLVQARTAAVSAHKRFARDARRMGMETVLVGPETKPDDGVIAPTGRLSAA